MYAWQCRCLSCGKLPPPLGRWEALDPRPQGSCLRGASCTTCSTYAEPVEAQRLTARARPP